jgi:hypothetical protein
LRLHVGGLRHVETVLRERLVEAVTVWRLGRSESRWRPRRRPPPAGGRTPALSGGVRTGSGPADARPARRRGARRCTDALFFRGGPRFEATARRPGGARDFERRGDASHSAGSLPPRCTNSGQVPVAHSPVAALHRCACPGGPNRTALIPRSWSRAARTTRIGDRQGLCTWRGPTGSGGARPGGSAPMDADTQRGFSRHRSIEMAPPLVAF